VLWQTPFCLLETLVCQFSLGLYELKVGRLVDIQELQSREAVSL
jgi:hypothetical protein